jgi:hypothetical protein
MNMFVHLRYNLAELFLKVSDKSCKDNQNTHSMFYTVVTKIMPLMNI